MRIQQAVHRTPITIMRADNGEWSSLPGGSIQELHGSTLGYRCANCRYPDVPNHDTNDGFHWQTLDHVAAAGVLSSPEDVSQPTITATICQPDGTTRRITLTPPHPGTLTIHERAVILAAHHAPAGSVLLAEGE
jgi:hypothetical protein